MTPTLNLEQATFRIERIEKTLEDIQTAVLEVAEAVGALRLDVEAIGEGDYEQ